MTLVGDEMGDEGWWAPAQDARWPRLKKSSGVVRIEILRLNDGANCSLGRVRCTHSGRPRIDVWSPKAVDEE